MTSVSKKLENTLREAIRKNPIIPVKTDNEKDDIKIISQLEANAISDIIYEDKKQWFWPHKRFKSHYKEIYEKNFNNK